MSKAPEITLKAGTRTVQVSDIPALMARAIHPEPNQPLVLKEIVKAYLGPNGEYDGRTQPLADGDMELLVEILGTPPRPGQATTDNQWLAYIAGWNDSPRRPTWTPGRQCINAEFDAALLRADAEDRVRKDLIDAIRAGSFVPLSHAMVPLVDGERELLGIGQVFVPEFRKYAEKSGISVRVEIDGVIIQDLASRIAEATADRHPEKWQAAPDTDPDPIRRTIVEAMNEHGWPADGIPGVLPFIYKEIESGCVEAYSTFNDLRCTDVSLVRTNPAKWYVTRDGEDYILRAIAGAVTRSQGRLAQWSEQWAKQRAEKEAAGRYTLGEAEELISTNAGERKSEVRKHLIRAVVAGDLTVYEPGRLLPYSSTTVRDFYEEAYWHDLNAWLDSIGFAHRWRFPLAKGANITGNSPVESGGKSVEADLGLTETLSNEYNCGSPPEWDKWAEFPRLTARQAILLMHGLNPYKHGKDGPIHAPPRVRNNSKDAGFFADVSHRIAVAESSDLEKLTPAEWQAWATKRGWKVEPQFMDMAEASAELSTEPAGDVTGAKPFPRQRYQEQEILRVIGELGYTASTLPKPPPGQDGPKAAVRAKLKFSPGVFDKAWERLRKQGKIKDAE